jgi:hypothetical protein
MSPQTIRIIITAALLLHGLAHGRALFSLVTQATGSRTDTWIPVRSWLLPSLTPRAAAAIAAVFWLLSTVGFIAASLSFYSSSTSGELWRQLAIAASIVSTIGIALFSGIWPGAPNRRLSNLDTLIALVMNGVILVALLWLQWPPYTMFGK